MTYEALSEEGAVTDRCGCWIGFDPDTATDGCLLRILPVNLLSLWGRIRSIVF
jgi:hypothetical protein